MRRVDVHCDAQTAIRMEAFERAGQRLGRLADTGGRARRGTRGGGPCLRQVIVDLALHALDLCDERIGKVRLPGSTRALGFVEQHRERRLQTVGEVPRLGDGARHDLVAMLEQAR